MPIRFFKLLVLLLLVSEPLKTFAEEKGFWNLPTTLDDSTTRIDFHIDTSWFKIHATTSGIKGKAWLADTKNFKSVRTELSIPVASFDTGKKDRNEDIQEDMDSDLFPDVKVLIDSTEELCDPKTLEAPGSSCAGAIAGHLTIRDVTKEMKFPYTVSKVGGAYEIKGQVNFLWTEFGIEDPSVFLFRVHKDVTVNYSITLRHSEVKM